MAQNRDLRRVFAKLGGVSVRGRLVDKVIECNEGTRKFMGLARVDDRFIGQRVAGTRGRGMLGSRNGEKYTLILDRPRQVSGRNRKTISLTIPSDITVRSFVIWVGRNQGKVNAIVTSRGERHSTVTDLSDRAADLLTDGRDLVGDLIPDFGDILSDGVADLIPDLGNPGQLVQRAADLVGLVNAIL